MREKAAIGGAVGPHHGGDGLGHDLDRPPFEIEGVQLGHEGRRREDLAHERGDARRRGPAMVGEMVLEQPAGQALAAQFLDPVDIEPFRRGRHDQVVDMLPAHRRPLEALGRDAHDCRGRHRAAPAGPEPEAAAADLDIDLAVEEEDAGQPFGQAGRDGEGVLLDRVAGVDEQAVAQFPVPQLAGDQRVLRRDPVLGAVEDDPVAPHEVADPDPSAPAVSETAVTCS
ncbi:hypothetical protein KXS07_04740 [Inquilinus limosus]|uniref:hypothetical protein n=1 Tax=Inquilinus limosus TaxID=171674 RepID=UPI003F18ACCB